MDNKTLRSAIDSVRVLSAEAIEKAKSGHPGTPLGAAPVVTALFGEHLKHDPASPYPDRDRFILSAGHASSMLYSVLHLCGYDITREDLASFRQLHSKLPGHPEYGVTPGVETSTGPLGQGIGNAVGFALAEKMLAAAFNRDGFNVVDHYTYAFCGDGCLMEGLSYEAASLAGSWKLGKLIVIYDKNDITIEGSINGVFDDDVGARFSAQGWQVIDAGDGEDTEAFGAAVTLAKKDTEHPALIIVHTRIGKGSGKEGSESCHGAPLGEQCLADMKTAMGWKQPPFTALPLTAGYTQEVRERGAKASAEWNKLMRAYKNAYPELHAELTRRLKGKFPDLAHDEEFWAAAPKGDSATRNHSGAVLNWLADNRIPELVGGSADLGPSNMSVMKSRGYYSAQTPSESNIHFGVRELAMASICNGISLHGGFKPYCATFFVFSDYFKGSVRMTALMDIPVLYILSHDSIGVGEDGPTHQPIEQLAMLRTLPNLRVFRPCDGLETAAAYAYWAEGKHPVAVVTSRQKLLSPQGTSAEGAMKGGYILEDSAKPVPDVILMGSGSEVSLLVRAKELLAERGVDARVVSMPCMEEFDAQKESYRSSVLPDAVRARVAVEAGSAICWYKYTGIDGATVCKDDFGLSAPASALFEINRFTPEDVVAAALKMIKKAGKR